MMNYYPSKGGIFLVVVVLVLLSCTPCTESFVIQPNVVQYHHQSSVFNRATSLKESTNNVDNEEGSVVFDRRSVLQQTALVMAGLLTTTTGLNLPLALAEEEAKAVTAAVPTSLLAQATPEHPIVVVGGGGKVGKIVTELLRQQKVAVRSVTRSGRTVLEPLNNELDTFITYVPGDVTNLDSIQNAVKGATAVVFAASASGKKKGGDPAHVDYKGLYNTAVASIAENVPKLVVVSSAAVTRPDSIGFKATNTFVNFVYGERIMDHKIAGENLVRSLYASAPDSLSYTIVRPGGLGDSAPVGATKIHVSQGDYYAAEIPRADVAAIVIASLDNTVASNRVTFEINQIDGLAKAQSNLPDPPSDLIHAGAPTYTALLDGLKSDTQLQQQYSSYLSTFGGNGIIPVDQIS